MKTGLSYCAAAARSADLDRFYAAFFAPPDKREALFGLLAFNAEIARTRETVSEPHIGLIRLAWWREALDEIDAGGPTRAHPVVEALAESHRQGGLWREPLIGLLEAREADLEDQPFRDEKALVSYAAATGGGLHAALAYVEGDRSGEEAGPQKVGTAWALTGLARSVAAQSLEPGWVTPEDKPGLAVDRSALIAYLAGLASELAPAARDARRAKSRSAMLPGALLPSYYSALKRAPYAEPWVPGRIARLVWASIRAG